MTPAEILGPLLPYAPVAALAAVPLLLLLAAQGAARGREAQRLRLMLAQGLAAQRGVAQRSRTVLERIRIETADRLARMGEGMVGLRGGLDHGLQAIRTVLSCGSGDL